MFGILNINKPKGITSFDVVARLRKILKVKQIGHTGTLDPMAQGVLPICIGSATRLIEFFTTGKVYRASMILGVTTDTYDLEGEEISREEICFDEKKFKEICESYTGEIVQIPPMYSAVHYNGKRLYEYARKNIQIDDIPSRKVKINSIEIVDIQNSSLNPVVTLDIDCSGGTYIRSLISDIGKSMGCGAVMSELIRLKSGEFDIYDSMTLEEVQTRYEEGKIEFINPIEKIPFDSCYVSEEEMKKIIHGQFLYRDNFKENKILKLIYKNNLLAIAEVKDNKVIPKKVFPPNL